MMITSADAPYAHTRRRDRKRKNGSRVESIARLLASGRLCRDPTSASHPHIDTARPPLQPPPHKGSKVLQVCTYRGSPEVARWPHRLFADLGPRRAAGALTE